MTSVQPCPYSWCAGEEAIPARLAGVGVVHHGPATNVAAADERLSVQVVGLPGFDLDDVYVEVATVERVRAAAHREVSAFLTASEVDELIAALTAARASLLGPGT